MATIIIACADSLPGCSRRRGAVHYWFAGPVGRLYGMRRTAARPLVNFSLRTASGPEGSSAKRILQCAEVHRVAVGLIRSNFQRPMTNPQPLPTPNPQLDVIGNWDLGVVGRWSLGVGN